MKHNGVYPPGEKRLWESKENIYNRIRNVLQRYLVKSKVIVVCHGMVIATKSGGGTYAAERRIGYKALRRAGIFEDEARELIQEVDNYFSSIGVTPNTVTRILRNRR
jgi:broad specificity phosphatase PhoE